MALMEWDDAYLIGIESLDYEHRDLINTINELHENLSGAPDKMEIEAYLGSILRRMTAHFAHEENLMQEADYAHVVAHKKEHEAFLDDYVESMKTYHDTADLERVSDIEVMLKSWIGEHIVTTDRQMVQIKGL